MAPNICELVLTRAPDVRFREAATLNGMVSLREECLALVGRGETTLEEVLRVTHDCRPAASAVDTRARAERSA
jgi:Type II secretory pathway, ATPase PulE/Tfp pilus assembly pathway, ATPase PilB